MLKDRKPKLRVDLPRDENDPSVYHELEDNGEAKQRQQDNEIVNDNCKSPTENTVSKSLSSPLLSCHLIVISFIISIIIQHKIVIIIISIINCTTLV